MAAEHGEIPRDDWKSPRAMSAVGDGARCQKEMLTHGLETVMKSLGPGAGEASVEVKERITALMNRVQSTDDAKVEHGCRRG